MRAYSLREPRSDAGMKAADVAATACGSWVG